MFYLGGVGKATVAVLEKHGSCLNMFSYFTHNFFIIETIFPESTIFAERNILAERNIFAQSS